MEEEARTVDVPCLGATWAGFQWWTAGPAFPPLNVGQVQLEANPVSRQVPGKFS